MHANYGSSMLACSRATDPFLARSANATGQARQYVLPTEPSMPSCSRPSKVKLFARPFGRPGSTAAPTLQKWRRSAKIELGHGRAETQNVQDHSRHVHTGSARPITDDAGSNPKYRPSSESSDCQFMRKSSPSATTRQPCHFGSADRDLAPPPLQCHRPKLRAQFYRWSGRAPPAPA